MFNFNCLSKVLFLSFSSAAFSGENIFPLANQTITAARQIIDSDKILSDSTIIDRALLDRSGNVSLADLLNLYAGVEISRQGGARGQTSVFLRGNNSSHVLLLIDGMRVGSTTLGSSSGSWTTLNSNQIERIEIMRSPASSLYGSDALGGVIQVFTTRNNKEAQVNLQLNFGSFQHQESRIGASGGLNFNSADETPIDKSDNNFFYNWQIAQGKSKEFSAVNNLSTLKNVNNDQDGYKFEQYLANFRYQPIKDINCSGNWIFDRGRSSYDSPPSEFTPWDQSWMTNLQSLTTQSTHGLGCQWQITNLWTTNFRYGENNDKSVELSNNQSQSEITSKQILWQWQNNLQLDFAKGIIALEKLQQKANTSEYQQSRDINSWQIGINSLANSKTIWQFNYRHDQNSQFSGSNNINLALGYNLTSEWLLAYNTSSAFRAPSFNDLYWPASSYASGNQNLQPEKSRQQQISLRFNSADLQFSLTAYQQKLRNLIEWRPDVNYFYQPINVDKVRIQGISGQLAKQFHSIKLSSQFTKQSAKNSANNFSLPYRAKNILTVSLEHDIGNYNWKIDWHGVGKRFADSGEQISLPAYALVNLIGTYKLAKNSELTLRFDNIFDKNYQIIRNYATAGRRIDLTWRQTWK